MPYHFAEADVKISRSYHFTRVLQIITPPLRGALIFTLFWGFRKFRGALIFFKNLPKSWGAFIYMDFGGERLFSLFFLLILVRICTVKPLFCKKNPAARAKFLGSVYFRIFSRSAYYFHFSAFRKFWRALIILRKSSEMTLERLLRGGIICNTLVVPRYRFHNMAKEGGVS